MLICGCMSRPRVGVCHGKEGAGEMGALQGARWVGRVMAARIG